MKEETMEWLLMLLLKAESVYLYDHRGVGKAFALRGPVVRYIEEELFVGGNITDIEGLSDLKDPIINIVTPGFVITIENIAPEIIIDGTSAYINLTCEKGVTKIKAARERISSGLSMVVEMTI
jgi:hypothetical protein